MLGYGRYQTRFRKEITHSKGSSDCREFKEGILFHVFQNQQGIMDHSPASPNLATLQVITVPRAKGESSYQNLERAVAVALRKGISTGSVTFGRGSSHCQNSLARRGQGEEVLWLLCPTVL